MARSRREIISACCSSAIWKASTPSGASHATAHLPAWRCQDSLSLRRFLDIPLDQQTPDHSSLTRIRNRLPLEIHQRVFQFILELVQSHTLIKASSVGVDSTLLEANAAMKAIVRKDTGEDWNAYLTRLMREEGLIEDGEEPSDDELRRFDKQRGKQEKKKVSNEDWQSPVDPESRIVKMKDGRTHLGYKAEHVIDLESEFILSAHVYHGTEADTATLLPSVGEAQENLVASGGNAAIEEVVPDAGYHGNETIHEATEAGTRTYIPEPKSRHSRRWSDKPEGYKEAFHNNRKRNKRAKGKSHQWKRSERVERSFAHVCETGGGRRSWLRGLEKINKRYSIQTAARNLGLLMLKLFGIGKPRGLQVADRPWRGGGGGDGGGLGRRIPPLGTPHVPLVGNPPAVRAGRPPPTIDRPGGLIGASSSKHSQFQQAAKPWMLKNRRRQTAPS